MGPALAAQATVIVAETVPTTLCPILWFSLLAFPTVGQKTVPMFGCFAKIEVEQIKKIR